ncbi:MAG: hypothetical protein FWF76_01515 [Oscillospiraceae bacterium]|nr:hypothetical protein [Oscillospiraceae bacterium]
MESKKINHNQSQTQMTALQRLQQGITQKTSGFGVQFKHNILSQKLIRTITLVCVIVVNLFFGVFGALAVTAFERGSNDQSNPDYFISMGIMFSVLAFLGIGITALIVMVTNYRGVFDTPNCYANLLTPVKRWKIILSRILTNMAFDVFTALIAGFGLLWQIYNQQKFSEILWERNGWGGNPNSIFFISENMNYFFWLIAIGIVYYFMLQAVVYYWGAISKSFFSARKYTRILTGIVVLGTVLVLNTMDYLLLLPGIGTDLSFDQAGRLPLFLISIPIYPEFNPVSVITFIVISLIRGIALFLAASHLIERRIDL